MTLKIIDLDNSKPMLWGNNCHVHELANTSHLRILHEIIPPGNQDKMHYHSLSDQFLYLLSGTIKIKLINDTIHLKPYQGVMIPAEVAHYVDNNGTEDAILMTIASPGIIDDRVLAEESS